MVEVGVAEALVFVEASVLVELAVLVELSVLVELAVLVEIPVLVAVPSEAVGTGITTPAVTSFPFFFII